MNTQGSRTDRMRAAGRLQAMPRREPLARRDLNTVGLKVHRLPRPRPSALTITRRGLRWAAATAIALALHLTDRLTGRDSLTRRGQRLRELFERVGGTAVKLGQQLAVRIDYLPFAVCQELNKLLDAVPPFDIAIAKARIEAVTGRPVEETFAELEPTPIGAASIACVWRGRLVSGERVAIKIQRPGIGEHFAADLALLSAATHFAEGLAIVPANFFRYLRMELSDMFLGELDFRREAHHHQAWSRRVKQDRIKWLSAPRLYHELCGMDMLTTEYVAGISCATVLAAVESQDEDALRQIAALDIDPRLLGHRIMELGNWGRLECRFFHADPHPGNIIVRPGTRIVMLDFGACGLISPETAAHEMEMNARVMNNHIPDAGAVTTGMLNPLPQICHHSLRRAVTDVFWSFQIKARSPETAWWERTSASLWLFMLEATRKFMLPVNMQLLVMIRATLLYDTLACRLNPDISARSAYIRWRKTARKRSRRRLNRARPITQDLLLQEVSELAETFRQGMHRSGYLSRDLPKTFSNLASKGSYFASVVLGVSGRLSVLLAVGTVAFATRSRWAGEMSTPRVFLAEAAQHPLLILAAVALIVTRVHAVRGRLNQLDAGER